MLHKTLLLKTLLSLILPLFVSGGCASQSSLPEVPARDAFIQGEISAVYPGPVDSKNHYLSSVAIHTAAKRADGSEHCSGILISPRDILTAGHCVCMKRKLKETASRDEVARRLQEAIPSHGKAAREAAAIEDLKARILANADSIIDASLCATQARVEVVEYLPRQPNTASSLRQTEYIGRVIHPHPRLLVLDDAAGTSWFREADLALIHLAAPVNERFRSIKLPEREVQVGNPVIMVGHGFGENGDTTKEFGDRHFGESVIETVEQLASGSVKFLARQAPTSAKPASRAYGGDSGGGCFSKADDRMLIGVISAFGNDGVSSIFTSVFAYKDWLKKESSHEGAAVVAP